MRHRSSPRRCRSPCFNPRPTLQPGDAPSIHPAAVGTECFNPRPTLQPGDAARLQLWRPRTRCFNPRPTLQPGDAVAGARIWISPKSFQSTPDLAAGRCASNRRSGHRSAGVSIHARPCSRAMRYSNRRYPQPHYCFNPRPTLQPGDACGRELPAAVS